VTNLIRRLYCAIESLVGFVPPTLRVVVSSATIGNPLALAKMLSARENSSWTVITRSGAREAGRTTVVLQASSRPSTVCTEIVDTWIRRYKSPPPCFAFCC
jgi:ATP-dependent helicase YprA (DUF1998 family)